LPRSRFLVGADSVDFSLLDVLGFGGTGVATTLAVLGLFWRADDAFSDELRDLLTQKLQGLKVPTEAVDWPQGFARLFDRVFGARHLSLNCFLRSCIASLIAVALLIGLGAGLHGYGIDLLNRDAVVAFLFFFFAFNLGADYLSLLETRWVLSRLGQQPGALRHAAWLVFDFVLTSLIFVVVGLIFALAMNVTAALIEQTYGREAAAYAVKVSIPMIAERFFDYGLYLEATPLREVSGTAETPARFLNLGFFYYSTLLTSLWLWLFIAGWAVVRSAARFQTLLGWLQFALPIRTKPMRAIGEVAALITALVFVVLAIFGVDAGAADTAAGS
jgi:hypothetical protein